MIVGDPTDAMRAVAEIAEEPFSTGSPQSYHIVEHPAGHLTLKKLIHNDVVRMEAKEEGGNYNERSEFLQAAYLTPL